MNALLCLSLLLPAAAFAAELKDIKSVYLYPMAGGLDQHLASRLTKDQVFRVVVDPKLADAVLTDQLGRQLEYRLDRIKRPIPPSVTPPGVTPPGAQAVATPAGQAMGMIVASNETEPNSSSFTGGKGTLFLVDSKSRQVVWSEFRPVKNRSPHELDKTAKRVAADLTKMLAPPPPAKAK